MHALVNSLMRCVATQARSTLCMQVSPGIVGNGWTIGALVRSVGTFNSVANAMLEAQTSVRAMIVFMVLPFGLNP